MTLFKIIYWAGIVAQLAIRAPFGKSRIAAAKTERRVSRTERILLACALFVFARAHIDLKSNWSPSLEIYQDHTLITSGIYHYIRHPMYASLGLLAMWFNAIVAI